MPLTASLTERVVAAIRRDGPMRFDQVMDAALYDPDAGFFTTVGGAGRGGGDFVTSPEVGPLFGAVLARALDGWWRELGEPDPFTVVEAGAGRGALARSVLAAEPACRRALRYVAVERSDRLRADHPHDPAIESVATMPRGPVVGVVVANELLDNLPVRLLAFDLDGWRELHVDVDDDGRLIERLIDADLAATGLIERLAGEVAPGARVPLQERARSWLSEALDRVARGRVVAIDYGGTTADLAARPVHEWLRTYRSHAPGGPVLERLGEQDVTCEVAVDQLADVAPPAEQRLQSDFLAAHGLDDLVAEGRQVWHERAHLGDLEALRARSRVSEAAALADPSGLGAFLVLEWEVDGPPAPVPPAPTAG